jgi:two-component system, chemotaxis family, response regulator Rcp1
MVTEEINVLLVEDDPADQKLIRSALLNQKISCSIHIAETGEEALEYLRRGIQGRVVNTLPNVILLDLNMPGMGGKDFLRHIKAIDDLCFIPVVVLTTSDSQTDIEQCYKLKASGYVQKPASPKALKNALEKFIIYWSATSLVVKN